MWVPDLAARLAAGLARDRLDELRSRAIRSALLGLLAALAVTLASACLTAAAVIALAPHTGGWQAALIVAAALLLLALATLLLLRHRRRRPRPETSADALAAKAEQAAAANPGTLVLAALAIGLVLGLRPRK